MLSVKQAPKYGAGKNNIPTTGNFEKVSANEVVIFPTEPLLLRSILVNVIDRHLFAFIY